LCVGTPLMKKEREKKGGGAQRTSKLQVTGPALQGKVEVCQLVRDRQECRNGKEEIDPRGGGVIDT